MSTPNFNHRFNFDEEAPVSVAALRDVIHSMTDRAESMILMIQSNVSNEETVLSPQILLNALEVIQMEVFDMRSVVDAFYEEVRHIDRGTDVSELMANLLKGMGKNDNNGA